VGHQGKKLEARSNWGKSIQRKRYGVRKDGGGKGPPHSDTIVKKDERRRGEMHVRDREYYMIMSADLEVREKPQVGEYPSHVTIVKLEVEERNGRFVRGGWVQQKLCQSGKPGENR